MPSTDKKTKQSRKPAEETKAAKSPAPVAAEETTKTRRETPVQKAKTETTPAAKLHRGAAKKTSSPAKPVAAKTETVAAPIVAEVVSVEVTKVTAVITSHNEIATLAYSYWEKRGFAHGNSEADWLLAEAELKSR